MTETPRKDIFVGREDQIARFKSMLLSPSEPWLLLITGHGGDGKTQLLNRLELVCTEPDLRVFPSGIIDFFYLINQRKIETRQT